MIIGVPREIKEQEYRIAIVPGGVGELSAAGHEVLVEKGAGVGTGFTDDDLSGAGAEIVGTHAELYARSEMIMKVKEPLESEYDLLREGQVLFCYLHLAADERLTRALVARKVVGIAFETIETEDGTLPLLVPMSQIAGHLSVLKGAEHLGRQRGGRGALVGRASEGGVSAKVVILGAGAAGSAAAGAAVGLGADVTVLDIDDAKLDRMKKIHGDRLIALRSTPESIGEVLRGADLVVGAVLRHGDKAPYVITRDMLGLMKKGSVIVDISIDQGGCVETSRPTTHADPVFEVDGVVHYCVANMPGCVPVASTHAITRVTLPWVLEIADKGWRKALGENAALARGLNVCEGHVTYEPVAGLFGLPYLPPDHVLG